MRAFYRLSANRRVCLLVVALLPVTMRVAMLPWWGVPVPYIHDEFGHLLLADTLLHGRFANPPHPLSEHLETIYILQRPTYSSIYPIGQAVMFALGKVLTGNPWSGVCLSIALMCAAVYWMLLAWTDPPWALLGGLLTGLAFGVTSEWMNTYYGGVPGAVGGAIVFGALPRLIRHQTSSAGWLLGAGGGIVFLVRPYECVVIAGICLLSILWFIASRRGSGERMRLVRAAAHCLPAILVVLSVTFWHNWSVTGDPWTHPLQLERIKQGAPQSFLFQPVLPLPRSEIQDVMDLARRQREIRLKVGTPAGFIRHVGGVCVAFFSFFVGFHFLPAIPGLLHFRCRAAIRAPAGICLIGLLWSFLNAWFFPRYFAPYLCLLMLLFVLGLQAMNDLTVMGLEIGRAVLAYVVVASTLVAFRGPVGRLVGERGVQLVESTHRSVVERQLLGLAGRHLVFIKHGPGRTFYDEWVSNDADVDGSRIVWARSLYPASDRAAIEYWKGRSVWAVYTDESPVRLERADSR